MTERIVVGVDGSPGSLVAARWAASEARVRRAQLEVVLAWEPVVHVVGGSAWVLPDKRQLAEQQRVAEERLAELVRPLAGELDGLAVELLAKHGAPVSVLLAAAKDASQLVLGTRGHGGFVGLLLGSVSAQCAHHAPCPLVIVPSPRDRAT